MTSPDHRAIRGRVALVALLWGVACVVALACGASSSSAPPVQGDAAGADATADDAGASDGAVDGADAPSRDSRASFGDAAQPVGPCEDADFPPNQGALFPCGSTSCWSGSQACFGSGPPPSGGSFCQPLINCGGMCDGAPSCACTVDHGSGACSCADDGGRVNVSCDLP